MRDYLMATLTSEERAFAADLLSDTEQTVASATRDVFANLDDPLLSAEDVAELLGESDREEEVKAALAALVEDGTLEVSTATQRPFDAERVPLYRSATVPATRLVLSGLQSESLSGTSRFQFSAEGRLIRSIARVDRLDALAGTGQQRKEIEAHVRRIADGVRAGTQIPNPVLLVLLEESTYFAESQGDEDEDEDEEDLPESFIRIRALEPLQEILDPRGRPIQRVRMVELDFPYRRAAFDDEKSVLLVDGQQRTAALSLVPVDDMPHVDLGVNVVISTEEDSKRVFQVANETVKISTDFSRALLASMAEAPGYLRSERIKAEACRLLSLTDTGSPFHNIVRYPGARPDRALVAYNSLFNVVNTIASGLPDDYVNTAESLAEIVKKVFLAVHDTWPAAWGVRPQESRLMHGAGLRAMSGVALLKLQAYLTSGAELNDERTWTELKTSLGRMKPRIVWTDSEAAEGSATAKKIWREEISSRQNTSQDIKALTEFLSKESLALDMAARKARPAE